jgi:3-hydroxyisobutyrate dehydrogenase-like beta-hydroxyacid dehydrogenase
MSITHGTHTDTNDKGKIMTTNRSIGWIGTGRMGTAMATRLISDGARLTVWNRTASKAESLTKLGASRADKITDLGRCDIVFTMVTSSKDLLEVTLGPEALLRAEPAPSIVVDCSTVSAEAAAELHAEAAALGIGFLSAPVSANSDMVAEGSASIVVSGPAAAFDTVEPYLRAIAPSVTYCGASEEARLIKLCHNLMLGIVTEALAEATTLAEKGGVPASVFLDFIDGSVLGCTHIRHKGQAIRTRNYEATMTVENFRKDFDLGLAAARTLQVPMPVAALTHQLIQTLVGLGYGKSDYVTLYEVAARAAALPSQDHQAEPITSRSSHATQDGR